MKKFFSLFVFFIIFLISSSVAENIHYWEDTKHIKVYIQPNHEDSRLAEKCFNTWESSLRRRIKFTFVNTPQEAQDVVVFANKLSNNALGTTTIKPVSVSLCTSQDKGRKNTDDCTESTIKNVTVITIANLNPATNKKIPKGQLYHIILHEIGHSLGLKHSKNPNDLMYYSTNNLYSMTGITANDIKALEELYGW